MRILTVATLLAGLLVGCGGAPTQPEPTRGNLHPHTLSAPAGVKRWEPSGATVIGERLWVANDKDAWIAAYALPLQPGANAPTLSFQLNPLPGRIKYEAVAPHPRGGLLLLEAISRTAWHCRDPETSCKDVAAVDLTLALAPIDAQIPEPVHYVSLESLAATPDRLWLATRGYQPASGDDWKAWTVVTHADGNESYARRPVRYGEREYGISDIAVAADGTLWMLWSHEGRGHSRDDVHGLLTRVTLDDAGWPAETRLCQALAGKPEGVAVWGEQLVIVFDQDRDRKDRDRADAFALGEDEDYARVLQTPDCAGEPL